MLGVVGNVNITGNAVSDSMMTMGGLNVGASTTVTAVSTDGTFAADSDLLLPTEQAVKTYVDTHSAPSSITASAPLNISAGTLRVVNSAAAQVTEISTDATLVANSNTLVPTKLAVKTYTDNTFVPKGAPITFTGASGTLIVSELSASEWNLTRGMTATQFYNPNLQLATSGGNTTLTGSTSDINVVAGSGVLNLNAQTNVTNATQSTTTGTGALVTAGGVGIGLDMFVGGVVHLPSRTNEAYAVPYIGDDGRGFALGTYSPDPVSGCIMIRLGGANAPYAYYYLTVPADRLAATDMNVYIDFICGGGSLTGDIEFRLQTYHSVYGSTPDTEALLSNQTKTVTIASTVNPTVYHMQFTTALAGASLSANDQLQLRLSLVNGVGSFADGPAYILGLIPTYTTNQIGY